MCACDLLQELWVPDALLGAAPPRSQGLSPGCVHGPQEPPSLCLSAEQHLGPLGLLVPRISHISRSTLPSRCSGSHQLGAGLGSHSESLEFTSWSSTTALPHQEGRAGLIAKFLHDLWLPYPQNRWASQGPIFHGGIRIREGMRLGQGHGAKAGLTLDSRW